MAKKSAKSVKRAKNAPRAMLLAAANEDDIDACDVDFAAGDLTADEDLPEAAGGVHESVPGGGNEDDIDACDVNFKVGDLSADEDLPASAGGVAT